MKRLFVIFGLVAILILILSSLAPIVANANSNAPRIRIKDSTSSNWSGYAVQTNLNNPRIGSINYVAGTWTVPSVQATTGIAKSYSSAWVGIDGYSDNTVEQLGTDQNWINGQAVYDAWYEMYPKYPVTIPITIHAGDVITASVANNNGTFTLSMTDSTTRKSFKTSQKAKSAKSNSAEWIMEAPWSSGVLPLANFGSILFSGATFNNNLPINTSGWQYDPLTMNDPSGGNATPSGLNSIGTSFSVSYSK